MRPVAVRTPRCPHGYPWNPGGICYPQLSLEIAAFRQLVLPIKLLVRKLCLIPRSFLRPRSTAADLFPGSGFPVCAPSDRLGAGTGFFLHRRRLLRQRQNSCVISIRSFAPFPWLGVFAYAHGHRCHGRVGFGRYPSRPASCWECPGCVTALCTGLRKLLDQKRPRRSSDRLPGKSFPPHSPLVCAIQRQGTPASTCITSSSKPFCPLSRYRPELQTCFSH